MDPGGGGLGGRVGYHRHHYNHNGLFCFDYLFNNESRSDHGESTTSFLARSRHADDLQPATENMKVETLTFTKKLLWGWLVYKHTFLKPPSPHIFCVDIPIACLLRVG